MTFWESFCGTGLGPFQLRKIPQAARDSIIEECARVAESRGGPHTLSGRVIAAAIRALKGEK